MPVEDDSFSFTGHDDCIRATVLGSSGIVIKIMQYLIYHFRERCLLLIRMRVRVQVMRDRNPEANSTSGTRKDCGVSKFVNKKTI